MISVFDVISKFQPFSTVFPIILRLILVIYALVVLYRVNGNQIQVFESIGVAIFPAFFIAYIATISPHYLNIFKPIDEIDDTPELGFLKELKTLKDNQLATFFIFIPIYSLITYQLNKQLIKKVLRIVPHTINKYI